MCIGNTEVLLPWQLTNHLSDLVYHEALSLHSKRDELDLSPLRTLVTLTAGQEVSTTLRREREAPKVFKFAPL